MAAAEAAVAVAPTAAVAGLGSHRTRCTGSRASTAGHWDKCSPSRSPSCTSATGHSTWACSRSCSTPTPGCPRRVGALAEARTVAAGSVAAAAAAAKEDSGSAAVAAAAAKEAQARRRWRRRRRTGCGGDGDGGGDECRERLRRGRGGDDYDGAAAAAAAMAMAEEGSGLAVAATAAAKEGSGSAVVATATNDRVWRRRRHGGGGGGECGERLGLGEWRRRVVVSKPNHVKRRLSKRSDPKCSDDDVRVCTHRWVTAARWRPKTNEENDRETMHRMQNQECTHSR